MIIAKGIELESNPEPVYSQAIARIERDLGYGNQQAHAETENRGQQYDQEIEETKLALLDLVDHRAELVVEARVGACPRTISDQLSVRRPHFGGTIPVDNVPPDA